MFISHAVHEGVNAGIRCMHVGSIHGISLGELGF